MARSRPSWALLLALLGCTPREVDRPDSTPVPEPGERSIPTSPTPVAAAGIELDATHHDARFGFQLAHPRAWTAREAEGMPVLFVSAPRENEGDRFIENVNVVVEELQDPVSAEAYADGSAPLLASDLVEYQELARSSVELGGRPAVRREYRHRHLERDMWVVSYIVVDDRRAFVITATAELAAAESWAARLDAVATSFRLGSLE